MKLLPLLRGCLCAQKANVKQVVKQLKESRVLSGLIKEGKIDVVGAYYNLKSGKVDFFVDETSKP